MTMKYSFGILIILGLLCCEEEKKEILEIKSEQVIVEALEVPNRLIPDTLASYDRHNSLWTINKEPFSGYVVSKYPDGSMKEKVGVLNGKKQNRTTKWFANGELKMLANYHKGQLHGKKKRWSIENDHILVALLNYHLGKVHGEQKLWYTSGEIYKKLKMNMGKEEGIQQAFRKNGKLYANYEAKEGRIFGLKKASLCYGIEDEIIQYTN